MSNLNRERFHKRWLKLLLQNKIVIAFIIIFLVLTSVSAAIITGLKADKSIMSISAQSDNKSEVQSILSGSKGNAAISLNADNSLESESAYSKTDSKKISNTSSNTFASHNSGSQASFSSFASSSKKSSELPSVVSASESSKMDIYGNTPANNKNRGIAAIKDNFIYYDACGLYKIKSDGTGKQLLIESARNINVLGEWIYFISFNSVYRIKADGKDRQRLLSAPFSRRLDVIKKHGIWLYFVQGNKIYRSQAEAGAPKLLLMDENVNPNYNITEDFIYYTIENTDGIYRVRIDGSNKQKIISENCIDFCIDGDWIFYISNDTFIYKIRTNGTGKQLIINESSRNLNFCDGWIYYTYNNNKEIIKIRADGTNRQKIIAQKNPCCSINIVGNWIYYSEYYHAQFFTHKVRTDGTDAEKLSYYY